MREKLCVIYKITNLANGKVYVGKSIDIERRWYKHKNEFKNNNHKNTYLQAAWNKYGSDCFKFEILELIYEDQLGIREYFWVNSLKCMEREYGYNIEDVDATTGRKIISEESRLKNSISNKGKISWNKGISPSEETRKKLSEALKGRIPWNKGKEKLYIANKRKRGWNKGIALSEETKKKISLAIKGRIVSEETKKKISLATKGRIVSDETREKMSIANKKRIISNETREKMSVSHKGKYLSEEQKNNISEGLIEYYSSLEARQKKSEISSKYYTMISPSGGMITFKNMKRFCLDNILDESTMNKVIHGKRNAHKGYKRYPL